MATVRRGSKLRPTARQQAARLGRRPRRHLVLARRGDVHVSSAVVPGGTAGRELAVLPDPYRTQRLPGAHGRTARPPDRPPAAPRDLHPAAHRRGRVGGRRHRGHLLRPHGSPRHRSGLPPRAPAQPALEADRSPALPASGADPPPPRPSPARPRRWAPRRCEPPVGIASDARPPRDPGRVPRPSAACAIAAFRTSTTPRAGDDTRTTPALTDAAHVRIPDEAPVGRSFPGYGRAHGSAQRSGGGLG